MVTETLWPDFTPAELNQIIENFSKRERRFGLTGEQIPKGCSMKHKISILGSTGSVGTSTLKVVDEFKDQFEVLGLGFHQHGCSCGTNQKIFTQSCFHQIRKSLAVN
jgi:hypothetical protein